MLDEFYRVAFRKKIYRTLDELQVNLDAWMAQGNRIWNLIDMFAGACGFGATRFYPCLVWFHGWRRRWKGLQSALRIWRIRGPAMPDDTICWRS